uniref:Uncharacterized protein n=1 Tax=Rhizophora mucronata TaxID=61149 RepID=A0A2P2QK66_RHIMU
MFDISPLLLPLRATILSVSKPQHHYLSRGNYLIYLKAPLIGD